MTTALIVAGIGLALVFLGIGGAHLTRWWDAHTARRRAQQVERGAREYLRRRGDALRKAQAEDAGRHVKPS